MRCSRSSAKNDATLRPKRVNPPQRRTQRAQQVEGRVEVGVDEGAHLDVVELGEPRAEATERRRLGRTGQLADLLLHAGPAVPHAQHAAVGVDGAVHRIDRADRDEVVHLGARRAEGRLEQFGHGEHGGSVVDAVASPAEQPAPPAGSVVALDDGDLVTPAGEVGSRGQPAQAGPDDDDAHG
jgi:hypothetical protein